MGEMPSAPQFLSAKQARLISWIPDIAMSIGYHHLGVPKARQTQHFELSSLSQIPSLCPQSMFSVPCHRNDSVAQAVASFHWL